MSYTDRVWSTEARDELRMKIEQLTEDDLRRLLLTVVSEANPDRLIATLRGALSGAVEMRKKIAALGIEEPTADAVLLAEMSAMRAELEAVKAREQAAQNVVEAALRYKQRPYAVENGLLRAALDDALIVHDQAVKVKQ